MDGKQALVITDCKMDRWKESELVKNVVDAIEKHKPTIFVAEQDKGYESLAHAIRQQCVNRGIAAPYFRWKVIVTTDKAAARRAKHLELPFSDGRLWLCSAPWTESVLLQLEKFDGIHNSNSHRKDDAVAALSLLFQELGPKYQEEISTEDSKQREQELEEEATRERTRHFYNAMFSGDPPRLSPQPTAVEQTPVDPRKIILGRNGPWRF